MKKIKFLMTDIGTNCTRSCQKALEEGEVEAEICECNGESALATLEREKPDVVLLEAFMPGLDALEVKKRYEKNGGQAEFLAAGSFHNDEVERQLMEGGFKYYFIKPFDPEVLVRRVLRTAGESSSAQARWYSGEDEAAVTEILHQIGVPAHIKGYQFLRDAILLTVSDPEYISAVTKRLYPEIAEQNHTTASRVERAIRHAIEVAWDRGDVDTLNRYFGYTIHNLRGKPTNSEFIAMISDKMRLDKKLRRA